MQRIAEREHDVVGDVDHVRDRTHAGVGKTCAKPHRRRADRDVAEHPPDVTRAAFEILDTDVDLLVTRETGIAPRRRRQLEVVDRGDLARDPVDRHQVRAVAGRLGEQDVLDERQGVRERRARLPLVGKNHDSRVIGAEFDLVLGEDHPVRRLTAQLGSRELDAVR